ncbi:MAG: response regulator [uncultured bacterium]|nr:MAG: response regulator [uncultured bacterium]HLD44888.1 response regulator [bacterium]
MSQPKILIVDDEYFFIETIKMRLETLGYDVIFADNGADGMEEALAQKPNLILADMIMPDMGGLELITLLRTNETTRHIPIIALSALSEPQNIREAIEAGANDYIVKPFESAELINKITSLLTERRAWGKT